MTGRHRDPDTGEKALFRSQILASVRDLDVSTRRALAAQACSLLRLQAEWQHASSVLFYVPIREELDVWPLLMAALASGKRLALPFFDEAVRGYAARWVEDPARDMKTGRYGIQEPSDRCEASPLNRLDLLLVPGVAFDMHGRRLGRGKGYYDRLLCAAHGVTCGVAFDAQIVTEVPVAPHDVPVNRILTPSRWLIGADAGPALE